MALLSVSKEDPNEPATIRSGLASLGHRIAALGSFSSSTNQMGSGLSFHLLSWFHTAPGKRAISSSPNVSTSGETKVTEHYCAMRREHIDAVNSMPASCRLRLA